MGLLDTILPVGQIAKTVGGDIHDAMNSMWENMQKTGSAISDPASAPTLAGTFQQQQQSGQLGQNIMNLANPIQTMTGQNPLANGVQQSLAGGVGAGFALGNQIGTAGATAAFGGEKAGAYNLGMQIHGKITGDYGTQMSSQDAFAAQSGIAKVAETAAFDPTTYMGTGLFGDALKGLGVAAEDAPFLGKVIPQLMQDSGSMWAQTSRAFGDAAFGPVNTVLGAPIKALSKIPVLNQVFAPSSRKLVFDARMSMLDAANGVMGSLDPAGTAETAITRLTTPGLDLSPQEQILQDHVNTLMGAWESSPRMKIKSGDPLEEGAVKPFNQNSLDALKSMSPLDAQNHLVSAMGNMQSASILQQSMIDRAAKAGWWNQTALPAMDWMTNGYRKYFVGKFINPLARAALNTPFFPVHLLSERVLGNALHGNPMGMMGDDDFLLYHRGNPVDTQMLSQAQEHQADSLAELGPADQNSVWNQYGTITTPNSKVNDTPGIFQGLKNFIMKPTNIARELDHSAALNTYHGMTWQALEPRLSELAESDPQIKGLMDAIQNIPGNGMQGMQQDQKLIQGVSMNAHNPAKLEQLARFAGSDDAILKNTDSLLNRWFTASPDMPATVRQAVRDYVKSGMAGSMDELDRKITTEQSNFNTRRLLAGGDALHGAMSDMLDSLTTNPSYVAAAPRETLDTINGLVNRYGRTFSDINYVAQRQTWSGMPDAARNKVWSDASGLLQKHIEQNGPMLRQLADSIGANRPGARLPVWDHLVQSAKDMADTADRYWKEDQTLRDEMGAPPRGSRSDFQAWDQERTNARNDIWNRYGAELDATTKPVDYPSLNAEIRIMGKDYGRAKVNADRQTALQNLTNISGAAHPAAPALVEQSRQDTAAFISDLHDTIANWRARPANRLQEAAVNQVRDISAALPDASRAALQDAIGKSYDSASSVYHNLFVDPSKSMSNLDEFMRAAGFPYWTYQSQKLPRLLKMGLGHPGAAKAYVNYYNDTDAGYQSIGDSPVAWDYGKFGLQKTANSLLRTGPALANWLTSGADYGTAAKKGGLPTSNMTNPVGKTLDMVAQYLSVVGLSPGAATDSVLGIMKAAEGENPDTYGILPSMLKVPGSIAAIPGTQDWIPPIARQALGGPVYALTRTVQTLMGDKMYDYYVNQELAKEGISPLKASPAQLDKAQHVVSAWQTFTEMSGAVAMRGDFKEVRDVANATAKQYGVPDDVIQSKEFLRNPTAVLYANKADGTPYLDRAQLSTIMRDHPEWNAWAQVADPLLPNDVRAQVQLRTSLTNDFASAMTALQAQPNIQPMISAALTPGSGTTGKQVRDLMSNLNQQRLAITTTQAPLWSQLPASQRIEAPEDVAADQYYSVQPSVDPITSQINWDKFASDRQDILDKMDTATQEYVLQRYQASSKWSDPKIAQIAGAEQTVNNSLQQYFGLGNMLWQNKYQGQSSMLAKFQTEHEFEVALNQVDQAQGQQPGTIAQNIPVLSQYKSDLAQIQNAYRGMSLETDAALAAWYDRKPVHPGLMPIIDEYGPVGLVTNNVLDQLATIGARQRNSNQYLQDTANGKPAAA